MNQSISEGTRERILEVAGEIFAAHGFQGTTVRDICQAAEANVAAVNYHFGDKQRLYVETVVHAHRWRMERAQLPDWTDDTPAETKLADFIATFIRRVRSGPDNTWQTRLLMREMMRPDTACAEVVRDSIRPQFELLIGILRDLLPAGVSDERLQLFAFSVVGQCLFYHFADSVIRNLVDEDAYVELHVAKLAEHITQVSLAGIGAAAGAPP